MQLGVLVAVGVIVLVGVLVAVNVGVLVGGVPVGVGPDAANQANSWSGSVDVLATQTVRAAQLGHVANPPPGFCHAAGEPLVTVRSVQPHSPAVGAP